jgi:hypothetical protein
VTHATVAGACVTVLKGWYDGSFAIPGPLQPNEDGTALVGYNGGDALTVEGELDKLASNVALGRNVAGVHWRSDATASLQLGEAVGKQYLWELKQGLNEKSITTFVFNDFQGQRVTI